jgi:hypothetical protein
MKSEHSRPVGAEELLKNDERSFAREAPKRCNYRQGVIYYLERICCGNRRLLARCMSVGKGAVATAASSISVPR